MGDMAAVPRFVAGDVLRRRRLHVGHGEDCRREDCYLLVTFVGWKVLIRLILCHIHTTNMYQLIRVF